MRGAHAKILWGMLAAGLAIRLVLAFSTYGVRFDIDSLALVRDQLAADPLHLYDALTVQLGDHISPRWPTPRASSPGSRRRAGSPTGPGCPSTA